MRIRLAHSPDPDDAFMFYGLASGAVDPGPYEFEHVRADIQTLNERAQAGEYEVSAISIRAYPQVSGNYALATCGCSMGDNYGPLLVSRTPLTVEALVGRTIAVPGLMTTAYLTLQLLLGPGRFEPRVVMFDRIPDEVASALINSVLVMLRKPS